MPDIRALKRRLEVLKHQPPKVLNNRELDGGEKLLKKAQQDHQKKRDSNYNDVYNRSYEAAGDLINLNRGRVMSYGGFGSGYRLGTGKWVYIKGKWKNKR
jgi:hypothetical protein